MEQLPVQPIFPDSHLRELNSPNLVEVPCKCLQDLKGPLRHWVQRKRDPLPDQVHGMGPVTI